jgi:hypothetical protein
VQKKVETFVDNIAGVKVQKKVAVDMADVPIERTGRSLTSPTPPKCQSYPFLLLPLPPPSPF